MANKIMLIACGSFSPPTPMHLRMFEIAKDHFSEMGTHEVIGGIVSPVHDAYGKKDLIAQSHRLEMVKIALQSSSWIKLSDWECRQNGWTRTRNTLQFHQNYLNSVIKDIDNFNETNLPSWIPDSIRNIREPVQIKVLCGADLLESFATPDLWDPDDIQSILSQHGIVVISRSGSNPEKFVFNSDLLTKHKKNITIITNWVANEVSSTLVRRLISREQSVKYLLDESVINYIDQHALYRSKIGKNFEEDKYILTTTQSNNTSVSTILLTPISPESENSTTYNESFIKIQNEKNESSIVDDYESMDETDIPPPLPELKSIGLSASIDALSNSSSLHKVFCCGSQKDSIATTRLNRPGSAVKILPGNANEDEKVGVSNSEDALKLESVLSPLPDDDYGTSDNAQTLSPTSPAQANSLLSPKIDESDSENSHIAPKITHGRFSPKTYDEMIKFVFTEHGIKVISDKEYVV